jgi:Siphovirus ReqiPepy6 Gp37-like protein
MAVSVNARDGNLNFLQPIVWSKVDLITRYNQVGAFTLTLPPTEQNWALSNVTDLGVVVDWNGVYQFTGYVETFNPQKQIDDSTGQITETITLSGADDLAPIANRIAYPDPSKTWPNQLTTSQDAQTAVKLESAIKHYVNLNAGPGAISTRQAPNLTVATNSARGGTVTYLARLADGTDLSLMDIIRSVVATGGPMGVSVTQTGGDLVFDVYIPRDLSKTAWFSYALGNLRAHNLSTTTPTCTNALVRGTSTFVEVTDCSTDGWTRTEVLVDQSSTTDSTTMTQAGQDAITQGAGAAALTMTPIDLPFLSFGTDYGLGDTVTVEIRDGVTYTDVVSQVELVADATGTNYLETVTPTIGLTSTDLGDNQTATALLAAKVRKLERLLLQLQAG